MPPNIFPFTREDLEMNRKGHLTIGQKEWLASIARGVQKSSSGSMKILLLFILLGGGMIGFLLYQSGNLETLIGDSTNGIALFFSLIIIGVLIAISRILSSNTANRLTHARVLKAEGEIRLDYEYFPNSALTAYYVYVGKKRFTMPGKTTHHTFQEGKKYRVYYVKANVFELILSLEKLD